MVRSVCTQMGDLYASAIGTTVLQIKEIPPRPEEYDGVLCLFGLEADEAAVRKALTPYGKIARCDLSADPAIVRFVTHDAALKVRRRAEVAAVKCKTEEVKAAITAALGVACAGADTQYNERSYDGRRDEAGHEDDTGRGWCTFESAASSELIIRLQAYPKMKAALDLLPVSYTHLTLPTICSV